MTPRSGRFVAVVLAGVLLSACGSEGKPLGAGHADRGVTPPQGAPALSAAPGATVLPEAPAPAEVPAPVEAPAPQAASAPATTVAPAPVESTSAATPTTTPATTPSDVPSPPPGGGGSSAGPSSPGVAAPSAAGTAGWPQCTSSTARYAIRFPVGWNTDTTTNGGCEYFDPGPVTVPANTDNYFAALMARQTGDPFSLPDTSRVETFLLREDVTIAGHKALKYETRATGQGSLASGTKRYGYRIDREGQAFEVWTMQAPGTSDGDYGARKGIVDQAVQTLQLLDRSGGGG